MSRKNVGTQGNRNHHLWNNNGTWWFHHTPIPKQRWRWSLKTKDAAEARDRRDAILRHPIRVSSTSIFQHRPLGAETNQSEGTAI